MTMTDPIADMLSRLRNANSAYHDSVSMPSSSVKVRIAAILQQEGYIAGYRVEENENGRVERINSQAEVYKTQILTLNQQKQELIMAFEDLGTVFKSFSLKLS